jgi:hypothetical protein
MSSLQMIEGTTEEVTALLTKAFAGRKVRAFVEPETEAAVELPDPPNTVRNASQLETLLMEGLASPVRKVTDETWDEMRREVHQRRAVRKRQ